jgi:hypothetical protein
VGLLTLCFTQMVPPFKQQNDGGGRTLSVPETSGGPLFYEYVEIRANGRVDVEIGRKRVEGESLIVTDAPEEGTYSILISLVVFNGTSVEAATNIPASRDEQLVTFSIEEPLSVTDPAHNYVIALSSIGGAIILFLLVNTIRYRNAQVFQLTQGKFIMAMLLSGLVAISSLVLLAPSSAKHCVLRQPLILLPLHIMVAILLGRMWRIRAVISPLLLLTLEKKEDWTNKWVDLVHSLTSFTSKEPKKKKIRRTITDFQLMRVISLLILPQVIVQILILITQSDDGWHIKLADADFDQESEACSHVLSSTSTTMTLRPLGLIFSPSYASCC